MALEALAHHEAGHAVAALAVGVPPECVWISPSIRRHRGVWLRGAMDPDPEAWVPWAWQVAITLAGPAAEALYGNCRPDALLIGHTDLTQAREALAHCPWISQDAAVAGAFNFLRRPEVWPAAERIAAELLRCHEIPGEDLEAVAWGSAPTPKHRRTWGEPLRRAFPPGPRLTPTVEWEIRRGRDGRSRP